MNQNSRKTIYGRCENCGGALVEKRLTVKRLIGGKFRDFKNVPVGVCCDCGERTYKGPVLERLERM
jgi:YgiT-type zinc finger domain-containing protein